MTYDGAPVVNSKRRFKTSASYSYSDGAGGGGEISLPESFIHDYERFIQRIDQRIDCHISDEHTIREIRSHLNGNHEQMCGICAGDDCRPLETDSLKCLCVNKNPWSVLEDIKNEIEAFISMDFGTLSSAIRPTSSNSMPLPDSHGVESNENNEEEYIDELLKKVDQRKTSWSENEIELFGKGVEIYGPGKWAAISKLIGTKTAKHVARFSITKRGKRFLPKSSERIARPLWTPEEEKLFGQGIKEFGPGRWALIAGLIKTKTRKQIRRFSKTRKGLLYIINKGENCEEPRMINDDKSDYETTAYSEPETMKNVGTWNDDEIDRFQEGIRLHGWGNWAKIAKVVGSRSQAQVRTFSQTKLAVREKKIVEFEKKPPSPNKSPTLTQESLQVVAEKQQNMFKAIMGHQSFSLNEM